MKISHLVFTITLLFMMIAVSPIAAADSSSPPLLPEQFYGNITATDGTLAPVGTILTATLDGESFTIRVTEAGKYGGEDTFTPKLLVSDSSNGGTISFHVGSVTAEKTDTYNKGVITKLDLVFSHFPEDSHEDWVTPSNPSTSTISYETVNPGTGTFTYTASNGAAFMVDKMTVFGALYASSHSIDKTSGGSGNIYVQSIDGKLEDPPNGWLYSVNSNAPSVYSNTYPVSNGDTIIWWYSDSMDSKPETSAYKFGIIIDTSLGVPVTNTTQVTILPSETIVTETKTADAAGYVTLEVTATVKGVQLPETVFSANPDASVRVVEGNIEEVTMPVGIKAEDVHLILEISVLDKDGKEISVETEGHFDISVTVPAGKQLAVGHRNAAGIWENCPVEQLENGQWRVTYSSLSPFAICFLDEGAENPFVAAETATPTETPTETAPVTETPTQTQTGTPAESETSSGIPVWVFIIGGVVIIAIVAGAIVLSRRR